MSFPLEQYQQIMAEAMAVVADRCNRGRNDLLPFDERYIHGHGDKVQECFERVQRVIGAYRRGRTEDVRADALDLINEAALLCLLIDLQAHPPAPESILPPLSPAV
jgi:hypothetical protein